MESLKVLLVDDEKIFIENMAGLLEKRDYQATAVFSGEDALKTLKNEDFDVVVLDLKMPGMDGLSTMKEIKKLNRSPEILMLTGHGSIATAVEAVKMGAYDYLAKPCEIDELVEKLEEISEKLKNNRKKKSILNFMKG